MFFEASLAPLISFWVSSIVYKWMRGQGSSSSCSTELMVLFPGIACSMAKTLGLHSHLSSSLGPEEVQIPTIRADEKATFWSCFRLDRFDNPSFRHCMPCSHVTATSWSFKRDRPLAGGDIVFDVHCTY